jgi:hypothetical protein
LARDANPIEHTMPPELSPETWTQVRYEYEHTDKPVDDICGDHGVSSSTLRDRMRRWRWTRRRQPIAADGPPPAPPIEQAAPAAPSETVADTRAGDAAPGEDMPPDPAAIGPRLQSAVARVLPAIEATLGKLAAGPMPPREMERAARTLTSLIRTLRELNELLAQQQPQTAANDDYPEDIDAFRNELARRIHAFVDSRTTDEEWELRGRPPKGFVPYGA